MARYSFEVEAAVVEQKLRFDSESSFEFYLNQLDWRYEPYKVLSKEKINGHWYVVIRKRYGEYPFLGEADPNKWAEKMRKINAASDPEEEERRKCYWETAAPNSTCFSCKFYQRCWIIDE